MMDSPFADDQEEFAVKRFTTKLDSGMPINRNLVKLAFKFLSN